LSQGRAKSLSGVSNAAPGPRLIRKKGETRLRYFRSGKVAWILGIAVAFSTIMWGCGPKPVPEKAPARPEVVPTAEERLDMARAYMEAGRVGDAALQYEAVLAENSNSFDANLDLGLALMTMENAKFENERDYTRIRQHLRAAMDIKPEDPRPYEYLGELDLKEKKYGQAIEYLRTAADLEPDSERVHEMLGVSLIEYGSAERGREELERTLAINPRNERANLEIGEIYEAQGENRAALDHLERALASNPNLDRATYVLERVYYNLGYYGKAEKACSEFLEHYPDDIQSLEILANIYRIEKRTGEMLEVYTRLTEVRPDNTAYWSPLVQYYMDSEDYAAAEKVLEKALEENPYYAYGNIRYGQLLMRRGDERLDEGDRMHALQLYSQAKIHFEKAKVDDRYISTAFQLIDQANIRIDGASGR
jgi:tetratricopeptide (TPR) repeat protein